MDRGPERLTRDKEAEQAKGRARAIDRLREMRVEGGKGGDKREDCNASTANVIATATTSAVNQYSPPHGR